MGKLPSQQLGKLPSQQLGKLPSQQLGKLPSQQLDEPPSQQLGKFSGPACLIGSAGSSRFSESVFRVGLRNWLVRVRKTPLPLSLARDRLGKRQGIRLGKRLEK